MALGAAGEQPMEGHVGAGAPWAQPRPGGDTGSGRSINGVSLPMIPSQPVLSARRAEEEANAIAEGPHSARVRFGGVVPAPPPLKGRPAGGTGQVAQRPRVRESPRGGQAVERQPRAQSLDHQRSKSERAHAPQPPSSAEERRVRPPAAPTGSHTPRREATGQDEALFRVLIDSIQPDDAGQGMLVRAAALRKLEAEASSSKRLQEAAQLLRDLQVQLHSAEVVQPQEADQPGDMHSLAAQAAYLEKKIVRLREKLKRRTKEVAQAAEKSAQTDMKAATVDGLVAEIARLRAERDSLDNERRKRSKKTLSQSPWSPPPNWPRGGVGSETSAGDNQIHHQLKSRLAGLHHQMKEFSADKALADSNADVARTLAGRVESRLKDAFHAREEEHIKLNVEREVLKRRIEEQDGLIAQMEGIGMCRQEVDELRSKVADAEREVAALRRERQHAEAMVVASRPNKQRSQSTIGNLFVGAARVSAIELDEESPTPSVDYRTDEQMPSESAMREEHKHLWQMREAVETALQQVSEQLCDAHAKRDAEVRNLEEELDRVFIEAERAKHKRRKQLANDGERKASEIERQAHVKLAACRGLESDAVREARRQLDQFSEGLMSTLAFEQDDCHGRARYLESQLSFRQQEMIRTREQHEAMVRRQLDLRGYMYLAIRNSQPYRRTQVLHYLSCTLGLPSSRLSVLEEAFVPGDTAIRDLPRVVGKPALVPEERFDAYVRPLPEFGGALSSTAAFDAAGDVVAQSSHAEMSPATTMPPPQDPDELPQTGISTEDAVSGTRLDGGGTASEDPDDSLGAAYDDDLPKEERDLIRRVLVEVHFEGDPRTPEPIKAQQQGEITDRFLEVVSTGGSLLDDVSVVGACSFKGSASFDADSAVWYEDRVQHVKRDVYHVSGATLVITAYRQLTPHAVKLLAVDPAQGQEFLLCFSDADLKDLLGRESELYRQQHFGSELVDLLASMLHIVKRPGNKPALVAINAHVAPLTDLNAPARGGAEVADVTALPLTDCAAATTSNLSEQRGGQETVTFEDLLVIEDRFFTLTVADDISTAATTVRLQESSTCKSFEATLPGRKVAGGSRQLRVCAQANELSDLILLLAIEEVALPPAIVIRIARGELGRPLAWRDPEQKVYCLSRLSPDEDGNLCRWLMQGGHALESRDDLGATLSIVPSKHRERLMHTVRTALQGGFNASPDNMEEVSEGLDAMTDGDSLEKKVMDRSRQSVCLANYGNDMTREGLVLRDSATSRRMSDAMAFQASATTRRLSDALELQASDQMASAEVPAETKGRQILRMGRRIRAPGGATVLCVFVVREIHEPYVQFSIMAQQIGTCRYWFLLVDSLEVYKKLHVRSAAGWQDPSKRRGIARQLVLACEFQRVVRENATHGLRLVLGTPREEESPRGEIAPMGASGLVAVSGRLVAPMVLSQEAAAGYIANMERYCILRGSRNLGNIKGFSDVRIYEEPDAPEASFMVNNFLIIATVQSVHFSLRLHDKALSHPLSRDEMDMLEPENRRRLLERVFASLDVVTSAGEGSVVAERLVMQAFLTDEVHEFEPDETGMLRPKKQLALSLDAASRPSTTAGALEPTHTLRSAKPSMTYFMGWRSRSPLSRATPAEIRSCDGSAGTVYIGGIIQEEESKELLQYDDCRVELARRVVEWGDAKVQMVLYNDFRAHAHVFELKQLGHSACITGPWLEMQIPTDGEPTRTYVEQRMFCGEPLVVCMTQQPFPHEVKATIFDPKSHEDIDLAARDDAILPLVERSLRERLSQAMEQLAKFGTLGPTGTPELCRLVHGGREIFPSDFKTRALQNHIPIVNVDFDQLAYDMPAGAATARELLFSCSRYVVNPSDALTPEYVQIDTTPLLRLSLSKKSYCQDFTFSIENSRGESVESHMLHIRDKLSARPIALYGEIQVVGDLRLLVIFLDDCAPRALRIAVIEPCSGWTFQMIMANSNSGFDGVHTARPASSQVAGRAPETAYLKAAPMRKELLHFFTQRVSARRGMQALPQLALAQRLALTPADFAGARTEHRSDATEKKTTAARAGDMIATAPSAKAVGFARETRFLDDDEVVLVSLSYEFAEDGAMLLRATASQPSSSKEVQRLLVNPGLDRLLRQCGLPPESEMTALMLEDDEARDKLSRAMLDIVEIEPSLEIRFKVEPLPKAVVPLVKRAATSLLDCSEERLLGRIERPWSSTKAFEEGDGEIHATLRVEVFDGADSIAALSHTTYLRLRVTDLETGRVATRDVHEEELEPWLESAGVAHLLCASREMDLVDILLRHAMFAEPGKESAMGRIVLLDVRKEDCSGGRFEPSFLESASAETMKSSRRLQQISGR